MMARSRGCDEASKEARLQMTHKTSMKLGMVGLGRMGASMVRRLLQADHECQ